jgi:hypothetical protein
MPQDPVRQLPAQSPPIETGPIRFGNDKTGVFIRADNALGFSITLRNLLQDSPLASVWLGSWKTEMEILLLLLESSQVGQEDHEDNDALAG